MLLIQGQEHSEQPTSNINSMENLSTNHNLNFQNVILNSNSAGHGEIWIN